VEDHFGRLDEGEVKYAPSIYDPSFEISKKDTATIIVKLTTEIEGLSVHYSFDNSFPDQFYPAATTPITVPKDAAAIKVITYRGDNPIGRLMVMTMAEMRRRAGIK
jgi:hexosaminidase